MNTRTGAWVALALIFAVTRAGAQTPPTPADRFDQGVRLATEGDYRAALAEFRAAFEATQNPEVLFNLAATHERLHEYVEAEETLTRYERLAPPRAFALHRAQVVAALARLRARIGRVRLHADPPDSTCAVDGAAHTVDALREGVRASAGRHVVRCEARGHEPVERPVEVRGLDVTDVTLSLPRRSATLTVVCAVEGAEVRVDGRPLGVTPLTGAAQLDEGAHTVELTRVGYERVTAVIDARGAARFEANLRWRAPVPDDEASWLTVRASEPGASVTIDGRRVANDGSEPVPPGRHRVRVERARFVPVERLVDLPRGARRALAVRLTPTPSYRDAWVRDARPKRLRWVALVAAGAAVTAGSAAWLGVSLARYLDADARFIENERMFNACALGGCASPVTYATARDAAADETRALVPHLAASAGLVAVGLGLAITGIALAAVAPDPDRFERAPRWHLGLGSLTARF